ncbi:choice-of-anchor V domain-containing protein [uncultured Tenacibaculum sp.]|uniref:choice-of-anchor V domain-containing protein n=1 Tax=uncultured Tenacibaculum sp. TaxID=174713 RepID=UPI002636728D|nr:choice-of-anchor V domain-containing protein [uncultured Tenacibaculum sp.]
MRKYYLFKLTLFLIPLLGFMFISFSGGRDSAFSSSPGDSNNNCTTCHAGTATAANLSVTTDIPVTGYEFNTEYNITVTNSGGGTRNGFQVTAEKDSDNSKIGAFGAGGADTKAVNSNSRATHTSSGNSQSTWSVKWTSPSSDQGKVTFYAASISGNGNGNTGGDTTFTGKSGSTPSLGINDAKLLNFKMYPNPVGNVVKIDLPTETREAKVQVYDYTGKLLKSENVSLLQKEVNIEELPIGMYLLKIISEDKLGVKHFIKK